MLSMQPTGSRGSRRLSKVCGQMHEWASRLHGEGRFGEFEQLLLIAAFAEYTAQIAGGIPMSQVEITRAEALGVPKTDLRRFEDSVADLIAEGGSETIKARLGELIAAQPGAMTFGDTGLDETHAQIQDLMRRFCLDEVYPHAHEWHLKNEYIPLEVIEKLAELGVFGLALPEEYGGMALGKEAMCVASEELSRGYIGVGSLGTRAEIAGELILHNGTPEQKEKYLPKIASGEMLPTAVFTEPNTGSDLASLKTRAVKDGDVYKITGQKTWITHPVRRRRHDGADVHQSERARLQGFVDVPRREAARHRCRSFSRQRYDGRRDRSARLSRHEGIRHFVRRFRSAGGESSGRCRGARLRSSDELRSRVRAFRRRPRVGVAQCAMDLGLKYALDRVQFGKPIYPFPRVRNKVVMMAVEYDDRSAAHVFFGSPEGRGRRCILKPVWPAVGCARRVGERRQRTGD